MKVFIEQPGDENKKGIFNKKTGKLDRVIAFHATYPYPYGYILDTTAEDGDNLDCFIITDRKFKAEDIVECEPIGIAEQFEDGQSDHNILMNLKGEAHIVDDEVKERLLDFDKKYFEGQDGVTSEVGNFLGREEALEEIKKCLKSTKL